MGKSTLLNRLLGDERQATFAVRESDSRGRHTTTHREMFLLPGGALVVDTPGLRELQLWGDEEDLDQSFADIAALATSCRFTNCRHDSEPGCEVLAAIASGALAAARLQSYRKLEAELAHVERLKDVRLQLEQKAKWKAVHKAARKHHPRE